MNNVSLEQPEYIISTIKKYNIIIPIYCTETTIATTDTLPVIPSREVIEYRKTNKYYLTENGERAFLFKKVKR